MAYDGSGNYSLPPGSVVSDGTTIDAADHNVPLTDIEAALSQVLLRSGVAPMTGDLDLGGFDVVNAGGAGGTFLTEDDTGTSGHKIPYLDVANTWTGNQTFIATTTELVSSDDTASGGPTLSLYRDSPSPAANDFIGVINWYGEDSAGNKQLYANDFVSITDPLSGSEDATRHFAVTTAGTLAAELTLSGAALYPATNNGLALGDAAHQWSDAFFASGAVLNFNNGDVTVTHGTNNLIIGGGGLTIVNVAAGDIGFHVTSVESTSVGIRVTNTDTSPVDAPLYFHQFSSNVGLSGSITGGIGGVEVDFNTSSDYRLKDNIQDLDSAGEIIDAIRPRRFTWLGSQLPGIGFVAHELQEAVPEAVTGAKDAVNEDGSIQPQQVAVSRLVPYLVAEIKALRARVAALEAAMP